MFWRKGSSWSFFVLLPLLSGLVIWPSALSSASAVHDSRFGGAVTLPSDPPRNSTGLTDVVQWDNYTLFVHDQRIFLHSGEFHPWRLPVPDLWLDIFQKMVAGGFNGGLSNPAPGVLDFDDWRAVQPLFDAAKAAGIFLVIRPGPYINAETTAGGLAHWAISLTTSTALRTNASDYQAAWTPYITQMAKFIEPNQVSNGGPVIAVQIDNEYGPVPDSHAQYFAQIEKVYRDNGIVVPFTYNDPGERMGFVNGTGSVDLYGVDAYPNRYDCAHPYVWKPVVTDYHSYHMQVNPSQPWFMPEFQGGSLDGWGGAGYDGCEVLTGPDFEDVFYKQNWASNVKLISYYMLFGGTSWGGLAYPGVYTSYDYGGAIRESRTLTSKFDELKRQGLFLRSSPEFLKTDWIGDTNTTIPGVSLNGSEAFITLLRNPDTGTGFVIARQNDSTSTALINFSLTLPTSAGTLTLPQTFSGISLNGRQSKIITTDYSFGSKSHLLYSTAGIFFAGTIGTRDILFLHGDSDQSHEFSFAHSGGNNARSNTPSNVKLSTKGSQTIASILPGGPVLITIFESDSQLVLFSDPVTAATFWAPTIASDDSSNPLKNYFQFGSNITVLVGGPYLVRNATITRNGELALRGDLNASCTLSVLAPSNVRSVSWNGALVHTDNVQNSAMRTGRLFYNEDAKAIQVPKLTDWRFADSLPEIQSGFSDEDWVVADHTTTNLSAPPLYGDGRVLYNCDYGFCENTVLYRAHFNGTGSETSANLSITGGLAFAASVWINDKFINTTFGGSNSQTDAVYTFPDGSVRIGEDNVLTVVMDNMGVQEDNANAQYKLPIGITGFKLNNGSISTWKIQGKKGGYLNYPDKVRGVLNEGGLFGERQGWHLPGFDTSKWTPRSLSDGLPSGKSGIGFFVTTFDLSIPEGKDVNIAFQFGEETEPYRALLFVNGWQFGKFVANLGPQTKFPVPPGILDYSGTNTIAVALWALEEVAVSPSLELVIDNILDGGIGPVAVNNPTWAPRP
ncbi:hypothetical protein QCA50_008202 [Cerrena zonata]|uniref:beta-galactosidase n=1 Tax=Cerrena zonata TaxID=2478898 RepID=A0AAW0GAL7_9APHY